VSGKPISTLRFEYVDTPERRLLDLEPLGLAGVPCLGYCHYQKTRPEVPEHHHPECVEVTYCLRTSLTYQDSESRIELLPGQILVTPPDLPHRLSSHSKGLVMDWMIVRVPRADGDLLGLPSGESQALCARLRGLPKQPFPGNAAIRQLFQRLFALYDSPRTLYGRCALRGACLSLLLALVDASEEPANVAGTARLQAVIAQMRQRPELEYPVDDLARQSGLAPGHLINRFKALTGLPPHQFLIACRINAAKERLRSSDQSITQIALDLGFSSSPHFSTLFRRQTGVTPLAWRGGDEGGAHGADPTLDTQSIA
jgi:AraC-like DNA-binding protein